MGSALSASGVTPVLARSATEQGAFQAIFDDTLPGM